MNGKSLFNPLDYSKSLLQEPQRLSDVTSWHEHIPFAFVLTEMLKPRVFVELGTHKGDSYLAFCQAIDTLGLVAGCYAVDTWQGEEHAGFYDESVYEELKAYHNPRYGRFSELVKCTFDEALARFSGESIDLLHIDGLHTYEAVKHDFETWLPKMSGSGVVLFHDTAVRERAFGVWRLWEEISEKYPSFEFKHGHGLGVAAVGSTVPEPLSGLFSADARDAANICRFFHLMGERIAKGRQVQALLESPSWRVTAPLRKMRRIWKKIC